MLGPDRPTHYRFKLGSFEVTTLLDGYVHLDGPHPIFGMDQSAEAVQAYAAENRLPTNRMEISFTQVLVNTGKELLRFDTGNAEARRPTAGHAEMRRTACRERRGRYGWITVVAETLKKKK